MKSNRELNFFQVKLSIICSVFHRVNYLKVFKFVSVCEFTAHLIHFTENISGIFVTSVVFQNQNEDTEWNDVLRKHGIIPQKEKEEINLEEADQSEPGTTHNLFSWIT